MAQARVVIDRSAFTQLSRLRAVVDQDALQNVPNVRAWKQRLGEMIAEAALRAFGGELLPGMTETLDSTRLRAALGEPELTRNAVVLPIADRNGSLDLLNHVEKGQEELDLKPFLLARAKVVDGVRSRVIPFTHAATMSMNPRDTTGLYARLARFEAATPRRPQGREYAPLRNRDMRSKQRFAMYRYTNPQTGYEHVSPLLRGVQAGGLKRGPVVRPRMGSAGRTGGTTTFRTVSSKSDPGSWVVPARRANPVREAILREALRRMGSLGQV